MALFRGITSMTALTSRSKLATKSGAASRPTTLRVSLRLPWYKQLGEQTKERSFVGAAFSLNITSQPHRSSHFRRQPALRLMLNGLLPTTSLKLDKPADPNHASSGCSFRADKNSTKRGSVAQKHEGTPGGLFERKSRGPRTSLLLNGVGGS